jgi:hypothetical protein
MEMVRVYVVPELHYDLEYLDDKYREYVYKSPEGKSLEHLVEKVIHGGKSLPCTCIFNYHDALGKYKESLKHFVSYNDIVLPIVIDYVSNYCDQLKCEITDNFITQIMSDTNRSFLNNLCYLMPSKLKGDASRKQSSKAKKLPSKAKKLPSNAKKLPSKPANKGKSVFNNQFEVAK